MSALLAEHDALKSKLVTKSASAAEKREFAAVLERLEEAKAEDEKAVRVKMAEIDEVLKVIEAAERVDLCFMVDATASMRNYIVAVKRQIFTIVKHITTINSGASLRLAFVAYRDFGPSALHLQSFDFVVADKTGVDKFQNFVASVRATSLGLYVSDTCEDVAGGLHAAVNLSWSHPTRVVFHIGDAPPHGVRYWSQKHKVGSRFDLKADFDHSGPKGIPAAIKQMVRIGIEYQFARITEVPEILPHLDTMVRSFNADAKKPDFVKVANVNSPNAITSSVVSSVTAATSRTVALLKGAKRLEKTKLDLAAIPEEYKRPAAAVQHVDLFMNKPFTDIASLCEKSRLEWIKATASSVFAAAKAGVLEAVNRFGSLLGVAMPEAPSPDPAHERTEKAKVRIAPKPFAMGGCRYAYKGVMLQGGVEKHYIFKEFIRPPSSNDLYLEQMEVSAAAAFLAKEYKKVRPKMRIKVLDTWVVKTADSKHYFVEEQLPMSKGTDFTKWCDNKGIWDFDEKVYDPALIEFAIWTYEVTKGYLMVMDLQGVRRKIKDARGNFVTEYLLTDPAIISDDLLRFSETNLGPKFLRRCLSGATAALELAPK